MPGGHNGLTEVGSDVAARANVTCTRPVPGPVVGPRGYAVNNQAQFASILAKGFANLIAGLFAKEKPGIHPGEPPHTRATSRAGPGNSRHHPRRRHDDGVSQRWK